MVYPPYPSLEDFGFTAPTLANLRKQDITSLEMLISYRSEKWLRKVLGDEAVDQIKKEMGEKGLCLLVA